MSAPSSKEINTILKEYRREYSREMRLFDSRPARYRPANELTPAGEALLLHAEIDAMNRPRDAIWGGAA